MKKSRETKWLRTSRPYCKVGFIKPRAVGARFLHVSVMFCYTKNNMEIEKDTETTDEKTNMSMPPVSTARQQSWGAFLAIMLIISMIVVGAIYAWNKRVKKYNQNPQTASVVGSLEASSTTK